MDITLWLAYIGVITVLIAIPGPSSLLITLHGYKYGFKKANNTIIGNLLGSLVLMGGSSLGIGVILTSSTFLFSIAKYIGASYLLYLGIKTLLYAKSKKLSPLEDIIDNATSLSLLKQGFLTGLSNPKDLLFFAALFPTFLSADASLYFQLSVLMFTWLSIDYGLKLIYLLLGKKLNIQFSTTNLLVLFNQITGGIFISFAMLLVVSSRE